MLQGFYIINCELYKPQESRKAYGTADKAVYL